MKAIRIETLNAPYTLLFLNDESEQRNEVGIYDPIIYVLPSEQYFISIRRANGGSTPALYRVLDVYLKGIIGLPYGEYDVEINGKVNTVVVDKENAKIYGGNIGKCKLLSTNNPAKHCGVDIVYSEISSPFGYYRIYEGKNIDCVDILSLSKDICLSQTKSEPPVGTVALCPSERGFEMSFAKFAGGIEPCRGAELAAAAQYISEHSGRQGEVIHLYSGELYAVARVSTSGVSLYAKDYSVTRFNINGA